MAETLGSLPNKERHQQISAAFRKQAPKSDAWPLALLWLQAGTLAMTGACDNVPPERFFHPPGRIFSG